MVALPTCDGSKWIRVVTFPSGAKCHLGKDTKGPCWCHEGAASENFRGIILQRFAGSNTGFGLQMEP